MHDTSSLTMMRDCLGVVGFLPYIGYVRYERHKRMWFFSHFGLQ